MKDSYNDIPWNETWPELLSEATAMWLKYYPTETAPSPIESFIEDLTEVRFQYLLSEGVLVAFGVVGLTELAENTKCISFSQSFLADETRSAQLIFESLRFDSATDYFSDVPYISWFFVPDASCQFDFLYYARKKSWFEVPCYYDVGIDLELTQYGATITSIAYNLGAGVSAECRNWVVLDKEGWAKRYEFIREVLDIKLSFVQGISSRISEWLQSLFIFYMEEEVLKYVEGIGFEIYILKKM